MALRRAVLGNKSILFYCDLRYAGDPVPALPGGCILEAATHYPDIRPADLQSLFDHLGARRTEHDLRDRFEKGATLWFLKEHDTIAAFIWSVRGTMVAPFFLPLTPDDVVLFDAESFPEYRGRGLYPLLVQSLFCKLREEKASRVYGMAKTWNASSLRGLGKTPFRRYAVASTMHAWGKTVTIWHEKRNA
ncbi:MAG: hypothetical protein ABSC19_13575 [Syntrophorhabdales bacterium]|jgi:hypothetical protein